MLLRTAVVVAALSLAAAPAIAQSFDDPKEFAHQRELMKMPPQGPAGKPWEQYVGGHTIDTSKYKKPGPYRICFSNAGVGNPWRVVGWTTMQAEVDLHKQDIAQFIVADAHKLPGHAHRADRGLRVRHLQRAIHRRPCVTRGQGCGVANLARRRCSGNALVRG